MRWMVSMMLTLACGAVQAQELSKSHPQGTPAFESWSATEADAFEHGQGIRLAKAFLSYRLYVDPASPRQGLYEFSRFRFCALDMRSCLPETIVWLRYDERSRKSDRLIFIRLRHRTWRRLWLVPQQYWKSVDPDTLQGAYELALFRYVLGISNALRFGGDPLRLTF